MSRRSIYSYKGRRTAGWIKVLLTLVLVGVLCFGSLLGVIFYGDHDDVTGDPQVMLILGCQVKPWGPSMLLQDRLDTALDYLADHPEMTVVVSGGQGPDEPSTEAQAMADYLKENGISEDRLLLEGDSHNTKENFQFSAALLEKEGFDLDQEVLVVSNGFHLTRARMLADRFGFENVSTLAAPSSHTPSRLKMYIREPLALVKSFLLDR